MKMSVSSTSPAEAKADALVCAIVEKPKVLAKPLAALDRALEGMIAAALRSGELTGERNKTVTFHTGGRLPAAKVICVGLGPAEKATLEHLRQAAASAAKTARDQAAKTVALVSDTFRVARTKPGDVVGALAEGTLLSQYRFDRFKKEKGNKKSLTEATLLVPAAELRAARAAASRAQIVCEGVAGARDLINLPGNEIWPETLARAAQEVARAGGLKCEVLHGKALETNKLAGVLAVGAGSTHTPRFIILEYHPSRSTQKPIVIVGKGVTFDSGGLSLKTGHNMDDMKCDMSGAAAVIHTMAVVAQIKPKFPVIALVPAVENMPSGTASRPGDIIRYASGQTAEIANTDAEGRVILADALLWAKRYEPAAVIDLATLTGACVVALGEHATGLFCTDRGLAGRITEAGAATFERVWELPLWEEYEPQIESDVADVKNVGGRPAGPVTAALFLKKFAEGYPWAHLDIAGTAYIEKERAYVPKNATGVGVRLLAHLITNWKPRPTKRSPRARR